MRSDAISEALGAAAGARRRQERALKQVKFVGYALLALLVAFSIAFRAFVLQRVWLWLAVPLTGWQPLSYKLALALPFALGLLSSRPYRSKQLDKLQGGSSFVHYAAEAALVGIIASGVALLLAALLT